MHGLNVVHGNLKGVCRLPSPNPDCISDPPLFKANVYVRNFSACIADFGISTIARTEPGDGINTGTTASLVSFTSGGCPRWTSPELLDPKKFNTSGPRPTKESDRYALGMVIYEVRSCELFIPRVAVSLWGDRYCVGACRTTFWIERRSTTRYWKEFDRTSQRRRCTSDSLMNCGSYFNAAGTKNGRHDRTSRPSAPV